MVLIPRDIDGDLAVVGLGHNLGPGRAPRGKGVLIAFWMEAWSRDHWRDSDDEVVAATVERINRLLPGWADGVEASAVARWDPSLVVATPGTLPPPRRVHRAASTRRPASSSPATTSPSRASTPASPPAAKRPTAWPARLS